MHIAVAGGTGTAGRYVVEDAERSGHDVVVLSRSRGVDVRSGEGLPDALVGVDVVIDCMDAGIIEQEAATAAFTEAATSLQRVGADVGVGHIVALSIVGIDRAGSGYYAAKLAQERVLAGGPVPVTVLRATQFHEFPAKVISWTRNGSEAHVFDVRVQPVAARTVARALVELAESEPIGRAPDLAGPEADIPARALIPGDGSRVAGPTFAEWLGSEDAALLPL